MKAIILAAGYATRLYPRTINYPKALLKINNIPLLSYIVNDLNKLPVTNIYIVTNGLFADYFYEWEKTVNYSVPIEIVNDGTLSEEDKLGAIGDIQFCIKEKNIQEDTFIIAGDTFYNFSLADFYNFYKKTNSDCVCAEDLSGDVDLSRFAVALPDSDNIIRELEEKPLHPKSNTVVYAIYIYKKSTMALFDEYLKENNNADAPGYFLQWLYQKKQVFAYKIQDRCFDIGTEAGYNLVNDLIMSGLLKKEYP